MQNANRRKFLEILGVGATAAFWSGPLEAVETHSSPDPGPDVSRVSKTAGNLIRAALAADCITLAQHSTSICPSFKQCLREHREIARLGGVVDSSDSLVISELSKVRNTRPPEADDERAEERLAFLLGSLCRLAADRNLGTGAGGDEQNGGEPDQILYRAAFVLRNVCGCVPDGEYSSDEFERILAAFWQRTLVRWHTFIPDSRDVEDWIERLSETRRQISNESRIFAKAFCDPDSDKIEAFVIKPNYYDSKDPLIALGRSLPSEKAEHHSDRILTAATASASCYARALRAGHQYLHAASDTSNGM